MPEAFSPDDAMKKNPVASDPLSNDSSANLSMGWLLPLLLLVLAAGLFFYFLNGSGNSIKAVAPQFIASPTDTATNKRASVSPDSTRQ